MILHILGIAQLVTNAVVMYLVVTLYLRSKAHKKYTDARVELLKREKDEQIAALERIITMRGARVRQSTRP
jgi:hypothetical protein